MELIDEIRLLIEPTLRGCGVELFDAHFAAGKGRGALRVMIDKPGGVTLEDCEKVSTAVSAVLDAFDPIANAYMLEVSSPGAERPLNNAEDWKKALGHRVNVHFKAGEGETIVEGRLVGISDEHVELEVRVSRNRETLTAIQLADVLAAHIAVDI